MIRPWERKKNKAQTVFYWAATVLIIAALVAMLFDFISWKEAIGLIRRNIPTQYGPVVLYDGGGGASGPHTLFNWKGPRGRVYLSMNKDLVPHSYTKDGEEIWGDFDGVIKGFSGINLDLRKVSDFPEYFGEGTFKNRTTQKHVKVWVYLLDKGKPVYKKVFVGNKPVDYRITPHIISLYKEQIDWDNDMTQGDKDFLCSFTHDSLHQFVIGFFQRGEVPKLFTKPNVYAYRLDQIVSGKVKFEKVYKEVLTNEREGACIGIIWNIDKKVYVRVVYGAWFVGCHDSGYVWSFWKR